MNLPLNKSIHCPFESAPRWHDHPSIDSHTVADEIFLCPWPGAGCTKSQLVQDIERFPNAVPPNKDICWQFAALEIRHFFGLESAFFGYLAMVSPSSRFFYSWKFDKTKSSTQACMINAVDMKVNNGQIRLTKNFANRMYWYKIFELIQNSNIISFEIVQD